MRTKWFGGIKANKLPDRLSVYVCVFWRLRGPICIYGLLSMSGRLETLGIKRGQEACSGWVQQSPIRN
jgi:hypothetical protein